MGAGIADGLTLAPETALDLTSFAAFTMRTAGELLPAAASRMGAADIVHNTPARIVAKTLRFILVAPHRCCTAAALRTLSAGNYKCLETLRRASSDEGAF